MPISIQVHIPDDLLNIPMAHLLPQQLFHGLPKLTSADLSITVGVKLQEHNTCQQEEQLTSGACLTFFSSQRFQNWTLCLPLLEVSIPPGGPYCPSWLPLLLPWPSSSALVHVIPSLQGVHTSHLPSFPLLDTVPCFSPCVFLLPCLDFFSHISFLAIFALSSSSPLGLLSPAFAHTLSPIFVSEKGSAHLLEELV